LILLLQQLEEVCPPRKQISPQFFVIPYSTITFQRR
jgi:hypothetical protein